MRRKKVTKTKINKRKARIDNSKIIDDSSINLVRHKKRLKYMKTKREMKRWEIRLIQTRSFLRVMSFIGIIWLFFFIANLPQWYLLATVFDKYPNAALEIEGNKIVSTEKIIKQLKNVRVDKTPIYLLNTKLLSKQILALTPVKNVYIRRFWFPARLKIVIDEKTPVLSITPSPKVRPVAVFNEDSSITTREFLPFTDKYKLYTILTYGDYKNWKPIQLKYLIALSSVIEKEAGQELLYIDIRNPDDCYAQLSSVKLRLGELNRSIFKRSKRIGSVITKALSIKQEIDYIDLRWDSQDTLSIKLKESNSSEKNLDKDSIVQTIKPE